ncbi:MAG: HAMP domain-containing histidine kinase [Bacteroidetes bacterium]|nr:HAMP domain-containing histidine kinase [Bacteroidota bacterium]MBU1113777.1 HAMP domain-containing histidine kinase [Bacteroidota bacterium]MBU1800354.1 HAMP domain-containing histidine kinase [Bacteroidota bacterium]
MIKLVPEWIERNDEFWLSLKRRNLFFIKLRFIAIVMLFTFNYLLELIVNIELSEIQHNSIGIITLFLFVYNLSLLSIRKRVKNIRGSFNPLHLSLVQILVDLTLLTLLIIMTGGIESPLYLFYIFHLIIGSLILPGGVIYTIAIAVILAMSLISYLQFIGTAPHFCVTGIYKTEMYTNPEYVITALLSFGLMTIVSVFLTNRIAHQLYLNEKKLYDALKELNNSELKKQKYIMGVVHEIKSPIAATKSIISLILDGFLGEFSSKIDQKLNRAVVRLNESLEMINNILRISRLRLLDEKTSEDVDINKLIDEILDLNKESIIKKRIKLKNISSNNFRTLKGDEVLLKLAFSNLIGNAIKYTNRNGTVSINSIYEKNSVKITICDNGIGIPQNEIKKVFDNYYRASNSNKNNDEGSGVGLSLVKEIIHQHRGSISVTSPSSISTEKNPGASFKIILPYGLKKISLENNKFLVVKGGV